MSLPRLATLSTRWPTPTTVKPVATISDSMSDRDRIRHRMVIAELERLGWTHGSEMPPVIATSTIVDGRALGGIIAISDLTTIEVWTTDDTDIPAGLTLREHDPVVRTAHHPNLARGVAATVVDLTELPAAEAGRAVLRSLTATTSATLALLASFGYGDIRAETP
jgi:hypothetical protein